MPSLRTASVSCLAIWLAIWLLFLSMRFSPLDIRQIPAIGIIMLIALAVALVTPILATGLAAAALIRQPRAPLNLLVFGCAIAAFLGQVLLFLISRWL
jgi:membrane protein DedA with SNARE-associated domain